METREFPHPQHLTANERETITPLKHPPVKPPHNLKKDIFDKEKLSHVDTFIDETPIEVLAGTLKKLVDHICANRDWSDLEKLWALLSWITSHPIRFIHAATVDQSEEDEAVLSPWQAIACFHQRVLSREPILESVCHLARIPCYTVRGKSKATSGYEQGVPMDWDSLKAWNIVFVAGSWRIVDSHFCCSAVQGASSGNWVLIDNDGEMTNQVQEASQGQIVHTFDDDMFLPDPETMKWIHFPVGDPKWQLTHNPVTQEEFENHFHLREEFYEFGMKEIPETVTNGVTETEGGRIAFPFGLTPQENLKLQFSYKLFRQREEHQRRKNVDSVLHRYVYFEQRKDFLKFNLRFPIEARFKIQISGTVTLASTKLTTFCCSYIIDCPEAEKDCLPLPSCPPIGYGVVSATEEAGLTPVDHTEAEVTTKTGYLEIRLTREKAVALHQMLKNSLIDEATLLQYTLTETVKDEVVIYLRLPKKGEYALNLFAQDEDAEGEADNVLNYLIQCQEAQADKGPFPNITTGKLGRNDLNAQTLGVNPVSHPKGMVVCGQGAIEFTFENEGGKPLVVELHSHDGSAQKAARQKVTQQDKSCQVNLDIPKDGEYALNVFCQDDKGRLHNVHSYLITKEGEEEVKVKEAGADQAKAIPTQVLKTTDWEIEIDVPKECKQPVAELHRRNGNDPPTAHRLKHNKKGNKKYLNVGFEEHGEYVLTVFDKDKDGHTVRAVARYLIEFAANPGADEINLNTLMDDVEGPNADDDDDDDDDAKDDSTDDDDIDEEAAERKRKEEERRRKREKEERLAKTRRHLDQARHLNSADQLEKLIKDYLDYEGEEDEEALVYAKHHLRTLKAKEALEIACRNRDVAAIDEAIQKANKANSFGGLTAEIASAKELRDRLERINKLRHKMLSMEPKTISEIKHYQNPPAGVHECLSATCLLLGYNGGEFKEWRKVQGLLSRSGQESVWSKIKACDPSRIPEPRAERSETFIKPFTQDQIRDVSAGAATFFVWSNGMIQEVYSENKDKKKKKKKKKQSNKTQGSTSSPEASPSPRRERQASPQKIKA